MEISTDILSDIHLITGAILSAHTTALAYAYIHSVGGRPFAALTATAMTHTTATPRKIQVTFSDAQVNAMLELLRASPLPASPPVNASKTWELGMDLEFLKDLKRKFEGEWSWKRLEERVNEFENYVVEMGVEGGDGGNKETVVVHYVHARSVRDDAVPLLLLHGWPGM